MTTVTPFPRQPGRRIVRKPAPMDSIRGALNDLREISRETEHDPVGIAQAVARIEAALQDLEG